MAFAAEPYGVFVDDLVSGLTGGVVRERFAFVAEQAPFRLDAGPDVVAATARAHGIAGGAFTRFAPGTDFLVTVDGTIAWQAAGTNPDPGTDFYVSYERRPDPQAPPLTAACEDRLRALKDALAKEELKATR